MAPPRRSTGGTRARPGPERGQSTISFASRVSKPVTRDIKKTLVSDPVAKSIISAPTNVTEGEANTKTARKIEQKNDEIDDSEEDDDGDDGKAEQLESLPEKSDDEIRAEKVSDTQITKYWREVEKQRIAGRVHQENLTVAEKVLRYFDMSSQYGVSRS
jgi:DNA polymerase delta subunit 4